MRRSGQQCTSANHTCNIYVPLMECKAAVLLHMINAETLHMLCTVCIKTWLSSVVSCSQEDSSPDYLIKAEECLRDEVRFACGLMGG